MKTFELLKELLLLREAGAYDSVDIATNLAIQIHCEQEDLDETDFKKKLNIIYHAAWDHYDGVKHTHQQCYNTYEELLNMLAR